MDETPKTNYSYYITEAESIQLIMKGVLVSVIEKISRNDSSPANESTVSRGTWWEITKETKNGEETFINKGASWEISGTPIQAMNLQLENDLSFVLNRISNLKGALAGELMLAKNVMTIPVSYLDIVSSNWLQILNNSMKSIPIIMALHQDNLRVLNAFILALHSLVAVQQ